MSLSTKEKVRLRGEAMRLKSALKVGRQGFSAGVRDQLDALLVQHGLVKVRLEESDREARATLAAEIGTESVGELIGVTGKAAVYYRLPVEKEAAPPNSACQPG
jgi:RNA-binding protein